MTEPPPNPPSTPIPSTPAAPSSKSALMRGAKVHRLIVEAVDSMPGPLSTEVTKQRARELHTIVRKLEAELEEAQQPLRPPRETVAKALSSWHAERA